MSCPVPEIRALIVDDEPLARRGIRQLLAAHRDVAVVGECKNGREAVRSITTLKPDLVFLDIQMPGLDGLGVIRVHGQERLPLIVFVTAHEDFAVEAFDVEATDYLVKPLSDSRFRATMARVRRRFTAGSTSAKPIAVPTDQGERALQPHEIDWIEANDDHATIHAGGRRYRLRATLGTLERRLSGANFARVHRAALVRVDHVREWKPAPSGGMELVLKDGVTLAVSRRRVARVKALLR